MTDLFHSERYYALALDPIHVGTGGYHLGRVDMSIVREPGTNLPKIPGTSISGACRTYAAMRHSDKDKWPHCAGKGQPDQGTEAKGHCGNRDCPICVTFGFVKGNSSFQGLAQFSDARLVLFPVHSMMGPVWITCPDVLLDLGVKEDSPAEDDIVRVSVNGVSSRTDKLNLGWLLLNIEKNLNLEKKLPGLLKETGDLLDRVVLVSNKLFSHIVNDNLEVRTSVSIDPATGAAADGALFTYEALPRGSVLAFDVVVSAPEYYRIGGEEPLGGEEKRLKQANTPADKNVTTYTSGSKIEVIVKTVQEGLALFETLGIGGMNTRGMGRLNVLGLDASKTAGGAV